MFINVNYFIPCVVICSWITLLDWRHDNVAYYWFMEQNVLWICHTHNNYMVKVTIISMTMNAIIPFCSTLLLKHIVNIIQQYIHFFEIFFRKRACFTISVSCCLTFSNYVDSLLLLVGSFFGWLWWFWWFYKVLRSVFLCSSTV